MHRRLLAVLVTSLAAAGSVQAQRPHTYRPPSRWVINGHSVAAFGTSVQPSGGGLALKTATGLGGGVQVGYMVTPRLTAYAGFDLAKQALDVQGLEGNFGLTHLEAGARLSFPARGSRMLPYVGAWVGRRGLTSTVDNFETGQQSNYSLSGLAAGVSGGVQYLVSPTLALDGGLSLGIGKFSKEKLDGQQQAIPPMSNSTTARLQFGANWYP